MRSLQIADANDAQSAPAHQKIAADTPWSPLPPPVPCEPAAKADAHVFAEPGFHEDFGFEIEAHPGAFLGLRAALVFNVGLGVLGLIGYEVWSLIAHWR